MSTTALVLDASSLPARRSADGALVERAGAELRSGQIRLEQSLLALAAGRTCTREGSAGDEVLFVLSGRGSLRVGECVHPLEPEAGAHLLPGRAHQLSAAEGEELALVSVRILAPAGGEGAHGPAAGGGDSDGRPQTRASAGTPAARVRRLADQSPESATANRQFRIIFDPASGLRSATHFVGYIPVGRAPDHFHTYDEVIYVLEGEGAFHTAQRSWPVSAASCIALPARTIHCLENAGRTDMRVLAVFTPAGSPAAAYYPDGTPAYENHESLHEEEVQA